MIVLSFKILIFKLVKSVIKKRISILCQQKKKLINFYRGRFHYAEKENFNWGQTYWKNAFMTLCRHTCKQSPFAV